MPRMRPEERRAAILAAAERVIARRGIAAATVRDVAAELGTSSGLIHHYFESMDDLLAAAFEQAAARDLADTVTAVDDGVTASDRLDRFINGYARVGAGGPGGMQMWLDAWAEAARRPAVQAVSRRLNLEWHAVLRALIASGCADGSMQCTDVDAAAWRILSVLDGLALQVVAHGDVVTPTQVTQWSRRMAAAELGLSGR